MDPVKNFLGSSALYTQNGVQRYGFDVFSREVMEIKIDIASPVVSRDVRIGSRGANP